MKVLVDTSVWVGHLIHREPQLVRLLNEGCVLMHPCVLGELALANLTQRDDVLKLLSDLEPVVQASPEEVWRLITLRGLHGLGLGYVDVHLLASVLLSPGATLWTRDWQLLRVCKNLGVHAPIQDRFFMHDTQADYGAAGSDT
ncbi:MAG TPA: type II toxin-antitoxin system VapC family toxin [Limnobacter sp.]|uniref:type II toxin-antitoxin system VapC family toxin n=1 Tax=Limnobacter sp. TaxID=2003368 RepID=UPI002ED8EA73